MQQARHPGGQLPDAHGALRAEHRALPDLRRAGAQERPRGAQRGVPHGEGVRPLPRADGAESAGRSQGTQMDKALKQLNFYWFMNSYLMGMP